jgi:phage tail sheath protein FI
MHNRKSFMSELLMNPAKWQLLNTVVTDNWAKVYVNQCSFGRGVFAATDIKKGLFWVHGDKHS